MNEQLLVADPFMNLYQRTHLIITLNFYVSSGAESFPSQHSVRAAEMLKGQHYGSLFSKSLLFNLSAPELFF